MRLLALLPFILLALPVSIYPQESSQENYITVEAKRRLYLQGGKVAYTEYEPFKTRTVQLLPGYIPDSERYPLSIYGGWEGRRGKKTGFYHVEKIDGRWWGIDPDGNLYFNVALNSISMGGSDRNKEALARKFGTPRKWITETISMLRENGFNCAGSWSDHKAIIEANKTSGKPFAYTINLNFMSSYGKERGGTFQQPGHTGYPGDAIFVFDPGWEEFCDRHARQVSAYRDDPNLFGYFSDNEMPFRFRSIDNFLKLPEKDFGRIAAEKWLNEKGIKAEEINDNLREEFLALVADRYFSAVSKAIRKYDPNHMYIGARFYSEEKNYELFMQTAGKYLDIISNNYYNKWTPDAGEMARWVSWSGRPFIITEYYTKGEDSGMPNQSGAGWIVKTQRDRGLFYQNYNLGLLENRNCVGWHYFKYQDNDPTAKGVDPSNTDSNKGIVNNYYEVWTPFMELIKELNTRVYSLISYFDKQRQGKGNIVRGWNILSDSYNDDLITIAATKDYNINHLQLSHDLVMDLRELRDTSRQKLVNKLVTKAHETGVKEVVAWDHALYDLKYYPEKFRTGPGGTIDLDNAEFWSWFKQDYRDMLKLVPGIDGIVLTFIETGARAENQYSKKMRSGAEKIAAVVDAVASVVCDELNKQLYIRTFAYTHSEYRNTIGCVSYVKNQKVRLMMKETPHDFFLTHPNDMYAGTIDRPTIMEFDAGNEFNGQGIIANTWPEYIISRWSDLIKRPNIIGYVARTDRYGDTRLVGTPNEILLYTLKRYSENQDIDAEKIYDEFITSKYGKKALKYLKPAFKNAFDIVTSSMYVLGTNVANHSKLDYDPYKSSYGRHVSGKWLDPPVVFVKNDVNREFHYWKDVIEHIAPARFKKPGAGLETEAPVVIENKWLSPEEMIDEEYLNYIIKEKKYAVKKAEEALTLIKKAKKVLKPSDYDQVHNLFNRTLITARTYEAVATAFYSYRLYCRSEVFRSSWLKSILEKSLKEMLVMASEIEKYDSHVPKGQWNWKGDAATARKYYDLITVTGWKEYGNVIFNIN